MRGVMYQASVLMVDTFNEHILFRSYIIGFCATLQSQGIISFLHPIPNVLVIEEGYAVTRIALIRIPLNEMRETIRVHQDRILFMISQFDTHRRQDQKGFVKGTRATESA